jgi:hypothetical protein
MTEINTPSTEIGYCHQIVIASRNGLPLLSLSDNFAAGYTFYSSQLAGCEKETKYT